MNRAYPFLLLGSFLPLCWLGMQAVHELGHVLGAWASGGHVERVVLHPLEISRTDVAGSRHPQFVVWAGPAVGVLVPLAAWGAAVAVGWKGAFLARFFAGFCLIANGAYLAGGSFGGIGDAGDLLRHGAPVWSLWLFGLVTISAGLALWNGLAKHFGLGPRKQTVSARHALGSLAWLVLVIILEVVAHAP